MSSSSSSKPTRTKNLIMMSDREDTDLGKEVAQILGVDLIHTTAHDFANGEIYVRFNESVRGSDAFVSQSHSAPINEAIMEQLIMIDAIKRA